jgi:hypothetical protein
VAIVPRRQADAFEETESARIPPTNPDAASILSELLRPPNRENSNFRGFLSESLEKGNIEVYNPSALFFSFTQMQLKKTLPLLIIAGATLASCTKPAEEAAPLPMVLPEAATPAEDSGAAAETAVPAATTEQAVPGVPGTPAAIDVTASGASATVNPDGSVNVAADANSVTTSADGTMTVSSPETGTMTIGNGQMAAPGVNMGADGSVTVDAGAAAGMGQ